MTIDETGETAAARPRGALLKNRKTAFGAAAALVIVAVAAALIGRRLRPAGETEDEPLFTVREGPLTISITESGTIENREKVVVKSKVEGQTTIIWLVDEGVSVEEGDLLVELDSSDFEQRRSEQEIRLQNAEADMIGARENLSIVTNRVQADIEKAELELRFARLGLEKYTDGDYPRELQQAEADITIAREEVQRAEDKIEWSQRLADQGYLTRTELLADELSLKRKRIDLELAEGKLALLKEYTHVEQLERLRSDVKQAGMALQRTRSKGRADIIQAEANQRAKHSGHDQCKSNLEKLIRQIENCKVRAPAAGMVVYATTGGRWHSRGEPLTLGQQVRERQELIHLPTTDAMIARISVQESSLSKVSLGLPAVIKVDALPGRELRGELGKIAVLPDTSRAWLNPDLKVFDCEVAVEGDTSGLRPGMSCRVEIIVDELERAVYVPLQAVLRVDGKPTVYVARDGRAQPGTVEIGMDNNRMVHVTGGLVAGERVLLNPPLQPSELKSSAEDVEADPPPPES